MGPLMNELYDSERYEIYLDDYSHRNDTDNAETSAMLAATIDTHLGPRDSEEGQEYLLCQAVALAGEYIKKQLCYCNEAHTCGRCWVLNEYKKVKRD